MKNYIDKIKNTFIKTKDYLIAKIKALQTKDYIIISAYLILSIASFILLKNFRLIILFTIIILVYYIGGYFMKKKNKNKKENKKKSNIWKKILIICLFLAIFAIIAFGLFCAYIVLTTETFNPNKLTSRESSIIYDKEGNEIYTLSNNQNDDVEKRIKITYDDLPQVLIDALIATEDSRFFQHKGVDLARFLKASILQVLGRDAGGASTLTMQVSKNSFTNTTSTGIKGIIRKFRDIYISVFQIEKKYTKEEIIEFYFNNNLLGGINFGVEQASEYYFGKSASELTLAEASLLVGMYQSPNAYNPYNHPEAATKRRKTVLKLMVRHGYITEEEAAIANAIPVESLVVRDSENQSSTIPYQGYINMVIEEAQKITGKDPNTTPMKIYTALNTNMQQTIDDIMSGKIYTWDTEKVQSGIAIVDVNTGEIVAVGAGRNKGPRDYNLATTARRMPGSTAKPLFDYGPAIEYENYSTYTLFNDEPWTYSNGVSVGNWDGKYKGLMTMKYALSVSRNIPALKTFQQLKNKDILNFVTNLGIKPEIENGSIHEAHAIGGFTGVTPLELATAYASFSNGGYHIQSHSIKKIEYIETKEIKEFKYKKTRVMADSTAYLITNMLEYAVNYQFNGGAKVSGMAVAAKTGTTNYSDADIKRLGLSKTAIPDLWTVAYTPEYSIAVWYGYEKADSENHLKNSNNTPKDKIMKTVMTAIPKTGSKFNIPSSVVKSKVEMGTWPAQLPSDYTPSAFITEEWFVKGTEPTEVSERFAKLDDVKSLEAKYSKTNNTIKLTWNHTTPNILSSSYLTSYFNQNVFGNESAKYLQERLDYNAGTLGPLKYHIYLKDDNNLKEVASTTNKEYTYKISINDTNTLTFVVKVEYEYFKSNASNGVTKEIKIDSSSITEEDSVVMKLIGDEIVNIKKGELYKEPNPGISITEDNISIYNICTINITVQTNNKTKSVANSTEVSNYINEAEVGTHYIKYTVKYDGKTYTKTRTINITE
jgi:penicillin-binding protein 1A